MASPTTASTETVNQAIFALVRSELQRRDGIFIGENHDEFAAREFLLDHLPQLKQLGVTTIYLEAPHHAIQSLQAGGKPCLLVAGLQDKIATNQKLREQVEAIQENASFTIATTRNSGTASLAFMEALVTQAKAQGIRVVGSDIRSLHHDTSHDQDIITARDIGAARVIEATARKGEKYIAYGGSWHSQHAAIYTDPQGKSIETEDGLPERLGIASIDFTPLAQLPFLHPGFAPRSAEITAQIEQNGVGIYTPTDGTATHAVIHKPGLHLGTPVPMPATTTTDSGVTAVKYSLPKALFKEVACQASPDTEHGLIPPARLEGIIRTINAERGK